MIQCHSPFWHHFGPFGPGPISCTFSLAVSRSLARVAATRQRCFRRGERRWRAPASRSTRPKPSSLGEPDRTRAVPPSGLDGVDLKPDPDGTSRKVPEISTSSPTLELPPKESNVSFFRRKIRTTRVTDSHKAFGRDRRLDEARDRIESYH